VGVVHEVRAVRALPAVLPPRRRVFHVPATGHGIATLEAVQARDEVAAGGEGDALKHRMRVRRFRKTTAGKRAQCFQPAEVVYLTLPELGFEQARENPVEPGDRSPFARKHRAPAHGYATTEKQGWRVAMWARIAASFNMRRRPSRKVFMIETTEGHEIERALSLGFREENLYVCNVNPAVVATLKRRYGLIHTYGVDADRALRRINEAGILLDVVSLDLCACLSARVIDTLCTAARVGNTYAVIAVNVLRGREQGIFASETVWNTATCRDLWRSFAHPALRPVVRALRGLDGQRLTWVTFAAAGMFSPAKTYANHWVRRDAETLFSMPDGPHRRVLLSGIGQYESGAQTFKWFVFQTGDALQGVVESERSGFFDQKAVSAAQTVRVDRRALGVRI
jgi:hypothetical protein